MNTLKHVPILVADDDADDRMMIRDALLESRLLNDVRFVRDGEELTDYLNRNGRYNDTHKYPLPGLILLDLNMPKKDGREALKEIKENPTLRHIPIVVLTTSRADEDICRTYDLGVNSFVTKPVTFESLVKTMKEIGRYWFEIVELPEQDSTAESARQILRTNTPAVSSLQ
ncbi:MAG: response regulator [Bdellovibrionia bacterium]